MNRLHHWYCSRDAWKRHVGEDLVPAALEGVELGSDVLEVGRVLRPGAPFAGTDSTGRGIGFALLHVGDTKVVVDPRSLGHRLVAAGFATATVSAGRDAVRFCASMPNN